MGTYVDVRFAVSLSVITVGAILAFGVTASPESVNIQVIGLILILVGLAGLATAHWLYVTRRRTDVIYRSNGVTLLEPNFPSPEESGDRMERHDEAIERHVESLPPDQPALPPAPGFLPGAHVAKDPRTEEVNHVDGVMDAEPGSEEFLRMQREWM
jgi:hypothetical protein